MWSATLSGALGSSSRPQRLWPAALPDFGDSEAKMQLWPQTVPCDKDLQPKWDINTSLVFSTGQRGRSSHDLEWARRAPGEAVCVLPHTAPLVLGPPTAFLPASICVLGAAAAQESPLPLQPQTSGATLRPGKGFFCRHWWIPKDLRFPKIESLSCFVQIPH